jgi:UDP-N-acetylmuramoyl-tripeptide--D-alanyl-D-alanine ligase
LEEAADTLHAIVEPGDVVLVKASRSAGLERLALDLIEDAGA